MTDRVQQILKLIEQLDVTEREELLACTTHVNPDDQAAGVVPVKEKSDAETNLACLKCGSDRIRRYGFYRKRRRYRCRFCGSTFNELSNSPIAGTHYPDRWKNFVDCMVEGLSVEKTAASVGVSIPTAFSWRHKLLEKYEKVADIMLRGIIEADETFFLFSEKGQKKLSAKRQARKRGSKATKRGISDEQVPVIVGCDRNGNVVIGVAGRGRISMADVRDVVNDRIGENVTLCTDAHSSFKAYAKAYRLSYVGLNISQGKRVVKRKKEKYHIQNVNNIHSRLKQWMDRFNGVSTKYLQNYMNWFSLLEETKGVTEQQVVEFAKRSIPSGM
jgi:transposase-like protein